VKKKITILSVGYWFTAYTLGMLLHPYKTVRELVRLKEFGMLVIAPTVMWGLAWLVGMVGLRFGHVILVVLGLLATPRFVNILAFIFWWLTTFLIMWQVLVGYLWVRFKIAGSPSAGSG
jgi:hypothetical protein